MSLLPVITLLDYNLFILKTARMSRQVLPGMTRYHLTVQKQMAEAAWGHACWEMAQKLDTDCCCRPPCPMEEQVDGLLMHYPVICGEESWAITRDLNLTDTQRSQAVSAKMSLKYFVIIDHNLLTQSVAFGTGEICIWPSPDGERGKTCF